MVTERWFQDFLDRLETLTRQHKITWCLREGYIRTEEGVCPVCAIAYYEGKHKYLSFQYWSDIAQGMADLNMKQAVTVVVIADTAKLVDSLAPRAPMRADMLRRLGLVQP